MPVLFRGKRKSAKGGIAPYRATPQDAIFALVQNFVTNTYRTNPFTNNPVPVKMDPKNDAYSVWFSKAEIDALFDANRDSDDKLPTGLRIYLGMHGNTLAELEANMRHPEYEGQYTTILVCTKQNPKGVNQDILREGKSYYSADNSFAGMGADEGNLCPPPYSGALSGSLICPLITDTHAL